MERKLTIEDLRIIAKETKHKCIKPLKVKIPKDALKYDRIAISIRNSEKIFYKIFF